MKMKIYDVILIILFILLLVVGFFICKDYKKMYDTIQVYDEIKKQCVSISTKSNDKKIHWEKLELINQDIVAWIDIPGTPINYPIVKSTDYDYYLTHGIDKKYSKYGTLFIDQRLYKEPFISKNLIVYGHNMGRYTDVMFSSLMQYEKQAYCDKHQYIHLYVKGMEKEQTYRIISVMEVSSSSDAYKVEIHKDEYADWIQSIMQDSIVACGEVDISNVQQILTLSTCTYDSNRLVVHCVKE